MALILGKAKFVPSLHTKVFFPFLLLVDLLNYEQSSFKSHDMYFILILGPYFILKVSLLMVGGG